MLSWLKLSPHHHSGRLKSHEYTSYLPLGILLLVVGLSLIAYTATASSPPPQSSSVGLSGIMPGKPPTVAAIIKSPDTGSHSSISPLTVSGTCPAGNLIELFKNDIFAGSTPCDNSGNFSIDIDPLVGQNTLIARVYDALNQPGPNSNSVIVNYDALPAQSSSLTSMSFGGSQMLLNTDAVFRGTFPDQELDIPIDILGGTPPYAVNIQWGDSNNKVMPRDNNQTFKAGHVYKKPGTYQISLQASDAAGRVAFLSVASIVNGQPSAATATSTGTISSNNLLVLWPLYTSAVAIMVSFWLGERREKRIIGKTITQIPPLQHS